MASEEFTRVHLVEKLINKTNLPGRGTIKAACPGNGEFVTLTFPKSMEDKMEFILTEIDNAFDAFGISTGVIFIGW